MPSLVNTQSNQIEEVPHEDMENALSSGTHNMQAGDTVNLVDSSGRLVGVPAEQVPDAISKAKFTFPTSKMVADYKAQQENAGPMAIAPAVAAGALRGAGLGLPETLMAHTPDLAPPQGVPTFNQMIGGLQQGQPGPTEVGKLAGYLLPGGAVTAPGRALAEDVLLPAAEQAAKAGAERIAAAFGNNETNPLVAKILSGVTKTAAKTLGSTVEAAPFGVGQTLSENSLGNADLNAENLMHNVGYAALFGAGLGGALGLGGEIYGGLKGGGDIAQAAAKHGIIEDAANVAASEPLPTNLPTSLEEMKQRVELGKQAGMETELPQSGRLAEVNDTLAGDSAFPVHAYQIKSFENPTERLAYKAFLKSGLPEAKDAVDWEALQKSEGVNKLLPKYVQEIAPDAKLTDNAVDGGTHAVETVADQIKAGREAEKPNFEKIDAAGINAVENPEELLNKVYQDLPRAKDLVGLKENGSYYLKPYDATTGVADETYKQLRNVVRALNKENLDISGVRNLRDVMGDKMDWLKAPKEAAQLSNMRRNLMDYMQDEVDKHVPDVEVRATMKRYAENEQNREIMEKIFGGSINNKAAFGKAVEPEKVLSRIFGSLENVKAAKQILGPKFDEISANYLSQVMSSAKDELNGFKTTKVRNLLNDKDAILKEALSTHPEQLNKINAVIDKMKALPDSPPGNPSETAITSRLLDNIHKIGNLVRHPSQILTGVMSTVTGKIDQAIQRNAVNKVLSGQSQEILNKNQRMYTAYSKIERMGNALTRNIDSNMNGIFKGAESIKAPAAAALTPEKYEKVSSKLMDLANNPEKFINDLSKATSPLHEVAPNITGSLHIAASRATQFLASKLPASEPADSFTTPHQTSPSDIAKFNRYYSVVQNPFVVLNQIKNGTLTKESLETIQTVYPQMYQQMTHAVMDRLNPEVVKSMPYDTKLMLSMFTGAELTKSLKASTMASAQVFNQMNKMGPQPGGAPSPKMSRSLSKIDTSNQLLTPLQQTERRQR